MKKTDLVRFRCTPEERKIIEDHARNDGLTLSEYLLNLVRSDRNRRMKEAGYFEEFDTDEFFSDYQADGEKRCKKLGIEYDPLDQFGTKKEWSDFYKESVNK